MLKHIIHKLPQINNLSLDHGRIFPHSEVKPARAFDVLLLFTKIIYSKSACYSHVRITRVVESQIHISPRLSFWQNLEINRIIALRLMPCKNKQKYLSLSPWLEDLFLLMTWNPATTASTRSLYPNVREGEAGETDGQKKYPQISLA